jgi:hypothetical protein
MLPSSAPARVGVRVGSSATVLRAYPKRFACADHLFDRDTLRAGLIHRLVISRVPVLIGQGMLLFGPLPHDVRLRYVATRTYPGGMVQTEYQVIG